ncbi:MAG: energy-coupling factor ABC transporter substrate-binding protein [Opitutaceae bacterium]|nr:energy-coupling factor ABC transporter substrate-binding protein [Opitutaceae bacterium]
MKKQNLLLLLGVIVLALIPLFTVKPAHEGDEIFGGADGQVEGVITEIRPDYKPWFAPFWEPPSGEIESLLFGLQAAIGAGAVAFCLGYYRGRRSAAKPADAALG